MMTQDQLNKKMQNFPTLQPCLYCGAEPEKHFCSEFGTKDPQVPYARCPNCQTYIPVELWNNPVIMKDKNNGYQKTKKRTKV